MELALTAKLSHLNERQINASRQTTHSKTSLTNVKLRSLYHWKLSTTETYCRGAQRCACSRKTPMLRNLS
jgi:hypothetical protein